MTRYTVVWTKTAQDQLADLWMAADDRNRVAATVAVLDRLLGSDAFQRGTALHEELRLLEVPPLRVFFAVREEDRMVEVGRVSRIG